MLQEANPKFYKEQLMMAKQGVELGARCHNNQERRAPGSCSAVSSLCLGRSQEPGVLLTPPKSLGIVAVSLAELLKSHEDCAAGLSRPSTVEC